jgi:hypothetical protein
MSPDEVLAKFSEGPLSKVKLGDGQLTDAQIFALRILLLQERDIFAKNDKIPGIVNKLGCTVNTGNAAPVGYPLRPTLPNMRPIVDEKLDELLQYGVIEHSSSPWAAAILLVPKKDGDTRVCLDYRLLNKVTKRDAYSLPRIDDCLSSLAGNKFFSALDLTSAYWQVPMASEEDKEKTAFRTHRGHFQFTKMPMGLVNAPAAMQRYMETALSGMVFQCALVFIDDILVYSPTFEQHVTDLRKVFSSLREFSIHLKSKKCELAMSEVKFLGHVVTEGGVSPDPGKVKCILDAEPESRKDIRAWQGLASYYRRYIKDFAKIVRPLTKFVHSKKPWFMSPEMKVSIKGIKDALTTEPILAHPNFDLPFEVHCDASPEALGAVLVQKIGSIERVVMFISRALRKEEVKYHQYEREALALYWSITVFRPYLLGKQFKVVTDCKALLYVASRPQNARLIRWAIALEEYDIEYKHRAGSRHGNADGLTRNNKMPSNVKYGRESGVEILCLNSIQTSSPTCSQSFYPSCPAMSKQSPQCLASFTPQEQPSHHSCSQKEGKDFVTHSCAITAVQARFIDEGPEDLSLPSLESLIKAQSEDKNLLRVRSYVDSCSEDTLSRRLRGKEVGFYLYNGVLMTNSMIPARFKKRSRTKSTLQQQICVPRSMRRAVLYSCHGLAIAGHSGLLKTSTKLRANFWWKGWMKDVKKWCKACHCQRRKQSRPNRHGLMGTLATTKPGEIISYDIVGPLPMADSGAQYLLTAIDHFTRYPFAIPITCKETRVVSKALHKYVFCHYGPPKILLSDCAKEFKNDVMHDIWKLWGSKCVHTSGYQPQANGLIERWHRWINANVTVFVNTQKTDWDDYIDSLLFAYRTSVHASTGFSPYELTYGRTATMPADLLYNIDKLKIEQQRQKGISISDSMRSAYRFAREHQTRASFLNKERIDKHRVDVVFKTGDFVLKYDQTVDKEGPKKFQYKFSHPLVVQRRDPRNRNLYFLFDPITKKESHINVNMLIPAYCEMGDLGPPLGWTVKPRQGKRKRDEQHVDCKTPQSETAPKLDIGTMVALRVEPDALENLPFSVGKVIKVRGDHISVQWFGKTNRQTMYSGVWHPGYYHPKDNKRYYRNKKLHNTHPPYTSEVSETLLTRSDILGRPFILTLDRRIPMSLLRSISKDESFSWVLPREFQDEQYVSCCARLALVDRLQTS